MKPYYEADGITIYHGDCREILPTISADVLVTDPPYGFGAYPTDTAVFHGFGSDTFRQLVAGHGCAAVFGYPEVLVGWCVASGLTPDEWVTWWATNAITGRAKWLQRECECVAIFGDPRGSLPTLPRSENSARIAESHDSAKDKATRIAGDVWRDVKPGMAFNAHQRLHPNEKPVSLMHKLVEMCSGPADLVFDPFMGSGTTLRAAKDLGRQAIGIEIEERYCEIAAKRLGQMVLDLGEAA